MDEHGWHEPTSREVAVLRADALEALVTDVGAGEVDLFVRRYLELLEQRLARLRLAAEAADGGSVREAALSLQTTSAMVGADELAGTVAALSATPAADAPHQAQESMPEIEALAAMATGVLVARASAGVPAGASA